MRKFLCILLTLALLVSLFAGCQESQGNQDPVVPAETDGTEETTVPDTTEQNPQKPEGNTTNITDLAPTKPASTDPAPTKPSGSNTSKPTEATKPSDPKPESNILAEGKVDYGTVLWKITKDGTLCLSGNRTVQSLNKYDWDAYADVITKIVVEDGIVDIPENAFVKLKKATSVYIGNAVKEIHKNAFDGCTGLTTVTFPKSLQTIGEYAFANCTNLTSVSFANGCKIELIKENAFFRSGLREFVAPPSLRTLESYAFSECAALETIRLEGGVQTITARAFWKCTGLKTVVLGKSIQDMGGLVFSGCNQITVMENYTTCFSEFSNQPKLTRLVIGGDRTNTGSYENCPLLSDVTILAPIQKIDSGAFSDCTSLKEIEIPDTVTVIENSAFRKTGLVRVTIPGKVEKIGRWVFTDTPLQEITFLGNMPQFDGAPQFSSCFGNVTAIAYYPAGNETWTEDALIGHGGNLTWVSK